MYLWESVAWPNFAWDDAGLSPLLAQVSREQGLLLGKMTQKGELDVTRWQTWFLACLQRAIASAEDRLESILVKARFRERFAKEAMNERQIKVLNRVLDGFAGKLTSSKWAKLAKCSQDTAARDINNLLERGVLKKNPGGGRSTSYSLA